jgi:Putative alpha-1,2-mannosidase
MTQETVRQVMITVWNTGTGGIPGNDDLGTLSSWYLWAAMGLYPQIPSRAELTLAAPLFPHIEIHRGNGAVITIDAPEASVDAKYIQSLSVNGKPTSRTWVPESLVKNGGSLVYVLGTEPNTSWGAGASDAPPGMGFFGWNGFFGPLARSGSVRTVTAGSAVPMIFSLGGDRGLDIFGAGSPSFQPTSCTTGEPLASPIATRSVGELTYDAKTDRYTYVWKTDKAQAGTCGRVELTTIDGNSHSALVEIR